MQTVLRFTACCYSPRYLSVTANELEASPISLLRSSRYGLYEFRMFLYSFKRLHKFKVSGESTEFVNNACSAIGLTKCCGSRFPAGVNHDHSVNERTPMLPWSG